MQYADATAAEAVDGVYSSGAELQSSHANSQGQLTYATGAGRGQAHHSPAYASGLGEQAARMGAGASASVSYSSVTGDTLPRGATAVDLGGEDAGNYDL